MQVITSRPTIARQSSWASRSDARSEVCCGFVAVEIAGGSRLAGDDLAAVIKDEPSRISTARKSSRAFRHRICDLTIAVPGHSVID